jgi:hypothetical protein
MDQKTVHFNLQLVGEDIFWYRTCITALSQVKLGNCYIILISTREIIPNNDEKYKTGRAATTVYVRSFDNVDNVFVQKTDFAEHLILCRRKPLSELNIFPHITQHCPMCLFYCSPQYRYNKHCIVCRLSAVLYWHGAFVNTSSCYSRFYQRYRTWPTVIAIEHRYRNLVKTCKNNFYHPNIITEI